MDDMDSTHDSVNARLSDYVDGELDATQTAGVEAHLFGCAACRMAVNDLRTIVTAAGQLAGTLPAQDLWPGVAARIAPGGNAAPSVSRGWRRFSFTVPQLAAAGILLMLLSGGVVYQLRLTPSPAGEPIADADEARMDDRILPVSLADPQYEDAIADLERTLEAGRGRLDAETIRVLEQNLAAIDAAIEQCRAALEADPANLFLNSHLVSTRQHKLSLLRRATALTTGS